MMLQSLKNSIAAFLIVCVMAPGFYLGMTPPPQAEAVDIASIFAGAAGAIAACAISELLVPAAVTAAGSFLSLLFSVPTNETNVAIITNSYVTAGSEITMVFKECILDVLAWAAKMIIFEVILRSIYDWIDEGFDGGPAFLSNASQFFKKLAGYTLEAFINETRLDELLCAPFNESVLNHMTMTLEMEVNGSGFKEYACTLESILGENANSKYNSMVVNGDIGEVGLSGAMALIRPGNNTYSAIFNIEAEADSKIQQVQGTEKMLLDFGDGHFSLRCDTEVEGVRKVCTPGNFVAQQINKWLGGGLDQLKNADEVSEVVAGAIAALVQGILFDTEKGLLSGEISTEDVDVASEGAEAGIETSDMWTDDYDYSGPGETMQPNQT
jgi:hypothetical protein